jgi:hypothetical protein
MAIGDIIALIISGPITSGPITSGCIYNAG